jgi:oxygen-independent coproporphyrinogen-3 oxidase
MNPPAIYIHVPWCRRRCPYCNFYIVVGKPHELFAHTLIREYEGRAHIWHQGKAASLYFGGGTPSLLPPAQIAYLIEYFIKHEALDPQAEITLEANPEDINYNYVTELKNSGVNRISLGTQSFDNATLKLLGRKHSKNQALEALDILQKNNFENISLDFIIGVPKEDTKNLLQTLTMLHAQGIKHFSTYLLTIEEKTNFHQRISQGLLANPQEDEQVEIYRLVQECLKNLAYEQYDISSFALPGFMSRHNQVYWAGGSYIGLGPGAHSMRNLDNGGIERLHNRSELKSWLFKPLNKDNYEHDLLSNHEALNEALAFGLRNMQKGICPQALASKHQCELPQNWDKIVRKLGDFGWLEEKTPGCLNISSYGALFADAIMREIVCA